MNGLKTLLQVVQTVTMNELEKGSGGRGRLFILFVLNKSSTWRRAWARDLVIGTIEGEGPAIERVSLRVGVAMQVLRLAGLDEDCIANSAMAVQKFGMPVDFCS